MTKVVFATLFLMSSYIGFSQNTDTKEASVEKSVFGIQTGLLGVWIHNEFKITNQIAFRSEIGLAGPNSNNIRPTFTFEPRLYYNLKNRLEKGKRIDGNSGDYISLKTRYHLHSTKAARESDLSHVLAVTTWGMRRNIGKHFNYEVGIGGGLGFDKSNSGNVHFSFDASLRIGYRF
ncbi:hypothetical protein [Kordia sp.]|uniref:hypothetical protein n=1 Tax=Kordia sp. TaxID=1965332 RepID=UPI003B596F18